MVEKPRSMLESEVFVNSFELRQRNYTPELSCYEVNLLEAGP